MRIVIAGGHGSIALLLSSQLATLGHNPVGLIRNAAHAADVRATGAEPVVLDLEHSDVPTLALALAGADAVVFAAGAGPGSSAERKLTVDRDGAILLADAALEAGVPRIVVVSSIGADGFDPESDDVFQVYLRAKSEADAAVRARDLDWTIVRPGALTDDGPTGLVTVGESVDRGSIPRADVAAVVTRLLLDGSAMRRQFEVTSGGTPISAALASL
ncbi:SDR family oxidoreductase [Lacisediminihabitans profunda]|uniref:SDR family oxidoreductase n=1 Tax=Lacisediminihabitans profunda TaxID=2594790 RepID=A0A5C8UWP4_9MICO|nr:SDR family oxidoreductase [Lacisediminihabitans profunda]TXN32473.1 SDR family oxidoreductase [Lacisediminihabitans profunda]